MAHVTVISEFHYAQQIVAGHHRVTADEPQARGGSDTGPSPTELLLGSLGACTSITLRTYAERKQWQLGRIAVDARFVRDESGAESTARAITITEALSDEQIARLGEIAEKTPVTKTAKRGTPITTTISRA